MKIRQFDDKQEWLAWRQKGICATDVAKIIGVSKWGNIDDLFKEKTSDTNQKDNYAMAKGRAAELIIRAKLESTHDCELENPCGEKAGLEWARASFDGINFKRRLLFEIKTAGRDDHQTARNGMVPTHYYPQIQWQLFVSEFDECRYVSAHDDKEHGWDLIELTIKRDDHYLKEILPKVTQFYNCLQTGTPPHDPISKDIELLFEEYSQLWTIQAQVDERMSELKGVIQDITPTDGSLSHAGFKSQWITKKGNVRYKDIPQLQGIDLDHYRGEDSVFIKLSRCE